MSYYWKTFDDGNFIGTIGSEGGKIIKDEENTFGARITLEDEGSVAPSSISLGVYGLMFHTDFFESVENGKHCFELFKRRIEKLIAHYLIDESARDDKWKRRHDELIEEIVSKV